MRSLIDLLCEVTGGSINQYWLDNDKPVMTKSGLKVKVKDIDYSKVPNEVIGEVVVNGNTQEWRWQDNGVCVQAKDAMGNNRLPDENDTLIKAE